MAKNSIRDFDNTAGNNTDIQSVDISEGCSPAGINNAIREVMADLADVNDGTVALESPQADSMTVTGDLTVDTDTLYVDITNDRIGVGTASPAKDVHIKTTTTNNQLRVESSAGNLNVGNDSTGSFVESTGSRPFRTFVGGGERMRIDENRVLVRDAQTGHVPTVSSTNSNHTVTVMHGCVIISGRVSFGSPYTQNLQFDLTYNNWGSNNNIAVVDMMTSLREYSSTSGVVSGTCFATNTSSGATFTTFTTSGLTQSRASTTLSSGGNYTLRITVNPTGATDQANFYFKILSGNGIILNSFAQSLV